jgi:hypothetical protein
MKKKRAMLDAETIAELERRAPEHIPTIEARLRRTGDGVITFYNEWLGPTGNGWGNLLVGAQCPEGEAFRVMARNLKDIEHERENTELEAARARIASPVVPDNVPFQPQPNSAAEPPSSEPPPAAEADRPLFAARLLDEIIGVTRGHASYEELLLWYRAELLSSGLDPANPAERPPDGDSDMRRARDKFGHWGVTELKMKCIRDLTWGPRISTNKGRRPARK